MRVAHQFPRGRTTEPARAIAPVRPGRVGDHPVGTIPTEDDPMLDGARIFHVNVNCSDLAASRAFYVDDVRADRGRAHHARRRAVGHRVRARPRAVGRVDPRRRRRLRRRRGRPPRVAGATSDRDRAAGPDEPGFAAHRDRRRRRRRRRARSRIRTAWSSSSSPARRRASRSVDGHVHRPRPLARVLPRARLRRRRERDAGRADERRARCARRRSGAARARPSTRTGDPVRGATGAHARASGAPRCSSPTSTRRSARLRAAGIALLSEPQAMAMGPGVPDLRFVCFRGPDHEVIELIESPDHRPRST